MAKRGRGGRAGLSISSAGEAIRSLRKSRGLSLAALSEKVGWDKSRLSRYENNQVAVSVDAIEKIADALEMSPLVATLYCLRTVYPILADPSNEPSRLFGRLTEELTGLK